MWSVRMMHEASLNDDNCFITLTYDENNINSNGSLDKSHVQKFLKRVRKVFKFRYFICGEYGDENKRPHYHGIIFGLDFRKIKREQWLEKKWGLGFIQVGECNIATASYVCGYVAKKYKVEEHKYGKDIYDASTGEKISDRVQPFTLMSRRPCGIGGRFFEKYKDEIYRSGTGTVIVSGREQQVPRYYDSKLDETTREIIKGKREILASKKTPKPEMIRIGKKIFKSYAKIDDRLRAKEMEMEAKQKIFGNRRMENGG